MKCFGGCELVSHEGINVKNGKDEIRLQTKDGAKIAVFEYAGHCQSAAKAINSHDALVEALESVLGMNFPCEYYDDDYNNIVSKAELALKKAKGNS